VGDVGRTAHGASTASRIPWMIFLSNPHVVASTPPSLASSPDTM
jgi:hypothetical protein